MLYPATRLDEGFSTLMAGLFNPFTGRMRTAFLTRSMSGRQAARCILNWFKNMGFAIPFGGPFTVPWYMAADSF